MEIIRALLCEILSYGADDHRTEQPGEGRDVVLKSGRQESADWKKQYLQGWCNLLRRVYRPPETDSMPGWIAESVSATVQCDSTAS